MKDALLGGFRALFELLAPEICPLCGEEAPASGEGGFCAGCLKGMTPLSAPSCPVCALPFMGTGPSHPCSLCAKKPPPFGETAAWGVFEGKLKTAVHKLKYGRNLALLPPLENFFLAACREKFNNGEGFSAVVPVPCHISGLRARGFDLPALLARKVAKEWNVPFKPFALRKMKSGVKMAGRGLKERRHLAAGLYGTAERVEGKILLVDDVITSTLTLRAAARGLRRGGAKEVCAAALARTPLSPSR